MKAIVFLEGKFWWWTMSVCWGGILAPLFSKYNWEPTTNMLHTKSLPQAGTNSMQTSGGEQQRQKNNLTSIVLSPCMLCCSCFLLLCVLLLWGIFGCMIQIIIQGKVLSASLILNKWLATVLTLLRTNLPQTIQSLKNHHRCRNCPPWL